MVQLGLSWWQAWVCVWIGYGFVAPFIAMNARPGAVFHVTFPVVARTSFGVYGSLWCTFNRGAMAWCVVPGHSFQVPSFILFFALFESVCGTVCRRASAATVSRCSCVRCGPASMTSVGVYGPTLSRPRSHALRFNSANHMPASSGTNTRDFMCFFLFWVISLPAIWFPIHQMYATSPYLNWREQCTRLSTQLAATSSHSSPS